MKGFAVGSGLVGSFGTCDNNIRTEHTYCQWPSVPLPARSLQQQDLQLKPSFHQRQDKEAPRAAQPIFRRSRVGSG